MELASDSDSSLASDWKTLATWPARISGAW
jgi:hypothetical protein